MPTLQHIPDVCFHDGIKFRYKIRVHLVFTVYTKLVEINNSLSLLDEVGNSLSSLDH